jgi:hypothetical protein
MFTASFLDPPKIKTAADYYEVDLVTSRCQSTGAIKEKAVCGAIERLFSLVV